MAEENKPNFNIIGPNGLGDEQRKRAEAFLEKKIEEARKPIEDESPRTEREEKIIQIAYELLEKELAEMGVKEMPLVFKEQFHFLKKIDIGKVPFFAESYAGTYNYLNQRADIRKSEDDLFSFLTISHEMLHAASFEQYYTNQYGNGASVKRGGYTTVNLQDMHSHFASLGELIADKILLDIILKNKDFIADSLKIDKGYLGYTEFTYPVHILNILLEEVSKRSGIKIDEIWQKIKKGFFTGETMHLRLIDRYLGRGVLRFISFFDFNNEFVEFLPGDPFQKIIEFIKTDDPKMRDEIAYELLNEREYLRYRQQAQKNDNF